MEMPHIMVASESTQVLKQTYTCYISSGKLLLDARGIRQLHSSFTDHINILAAEFIYLASSAECTGPINQPTAVKELSTYLNSVLTSRYLTTSHQAQSECCLLLFRHHLVNCCKGSDNRGDYSPQVGQGFLRWVELM